MSNLERYLDSLGPSYQESVVVLYDAITEHIRALDALRLDFLTECQNEIAAHTIQEDIEKWKAARAELDQWSFSVWQMQA